MILDVRRPGEIAAGSIGAGLGVPLHELPRGRDEIPRDVELVVVCAGG